MELQVRFWPISCRLCLFAEITLTKSHFCEICLRLNPILSSNHGRSNLCLAVLKMPAFSVPSCSFSALPKQHWDDQKWFSYWTLETLLASCSHTSTMLQWPDKRWRGFFFFYIYPISYWCFYVHSSLQSNYFCSRLYYNIYIMQNQPLKPTSG